MDETVSRPSEVVTIHKDDSIFAAAVKMQSFGVGCLVVVDENNKPAGIISEKDIVVKAVAISMDLQHAPVTSIMTTRLIASNIFGMAFCIWVFCFKRLDKSPNALDKHFFRLCRQRGDLTL